MSQATVAVRLDQATQDRLKALGETKDRSPHYLMKAAIEAFLEKEEAIEAEKALLRDRWDKYELTGDTISHGDMKDWAKSLSSSE